jgi:site-specific DNA-methyltransferase (adenine-specific)
MEIRRVFIAFLTDVMRECLRVLKPGGHAVVWALPRTAHWTATAIEDAGFEIRDIIHHVFGSGFPKSKNLDGAWVGWGTALKPAAENWIVARKPLDKNTVVANVLKHGTGALNIDACRTGTVADNPGNTMVSKKFSGRDYNAGKEGWDDRPRGEAFVQRPEGRWPANLVLSHTPGCRQVGERKAAAYECVEGCPVAELDRQSGDRPVSGAAKAGKTHTQAGIGYGSTAVRAVANLPSDSGTASRYFNTFEPYAIDEAVPFFYRAKASRKDRGEGNRHPTVKSTALMRYLVRLVTPPGCTVLDPFAGSGSTGVAALLEGFNFIGIEREPEYVETARARLQHEAPQVVRKGMPRRGRV